MVSLGLTPCQSRYIWSSVSGPLCLSITRARPCLPWPPILQPSSCLCCPKLATSCPPLIKYCPPPSSNFLLHPPHHPPSWGRAPGRARGTCLSWLMSSTLPTGGVQYRDNAALWCPPPLLTQALTLRHYLIRARPMGWGPPRNKQAEDKGRGSTSPEPWAWVGLRVSGQTPVCRWGN